VIPFSAAMEKMGYRGDMQVACPGQWQIPGTSIALKDWKPEGHGVLPFTQALTESCNAPFYDIGYKLNTMDPMILPSWARNFGLGEKTGLVGIQESPGILPDPAWKLRVVGQSWFPGDAVNLAIGQGFFQATPLQMANVYATLATKGLLRTPVLVQRVNTVEGQLVKAYAADERSRLPAQPATLAAVYEGMLRVGSTPLGTGYYAFKGFATPMASKTGSAENQGPQEHAWFAGYAPAEAPEVVVIVMMEGGGAGGSIAAPRARQMMDFFFPAKKP
jgi:penicillin-binding protein 2